MGKRWIVETAAGESEDVGADSMSVNGGALLFYVKNELILAYGPGRWSTIEPQGEQ